MAPRAPLLALAVGTVALLLPLPAGAGWGGDLNPGDGPRLLLDVQKDLLPIVRAPEAERADRIQRFAAKSAPGALEAIKRFRNPELLDLFVTLLDHEDWQVVHRALFVLEHYWDAASFPRAWTLIQHPHRRVREKAAVTCIKLWDGSRSAGDVRALAEREPDPHVRGALAALERRATGSLAMDRVHREPVATLDNGLLVVPFLEGWGRREDVLPGYAPQAVLRTGKGSAAKLPAADRWVLPLITFGQEEIPGAPLMPFGSLDPGGADHHLGEDAGACLDGAGVYAPAPGVVKLVRAGGESGTVIATEHSLGAGRVVTSLLAHGGDTVFVQAGDRVEAGQLLTTVGLSWSIENGGRIAHVHLGLLEGPYEEAAMRVTAPVAEGLGRWVDPTEFLASWTLRTGPVVVVPRRLAADYDAALAHLQKDDVARAWAEAERVFQATADPAVRTDGDVLLDALALAPGNAMRRARAWLDAGHPTAALADLERWAGRLHGMPDATTVEEQVRAWKADKGIQKALQGEPKVEAAERKAAKARDRRALREAWEALLDAYGDTCLAPRIEMHLRD